MGGPDRGRVIVELSGGAELLVRPVPPYTTGLVLAKYPEPEYPYVTIRSGAGGGEVRPALRGTPEYEEWTKAVDRHRVEIKEALTDFTLEYGILGWRFDRDVGFTDQVPDDWDIPGILKAQFGLAKAPSRSSALKLQYIKYALIQLQHDRDVVDIALMGPMEPLTDAEIQAAMRPFESDGGTELH